MKHFSLAMKHVFLMIFATVLPTISQENNTTRFSDIVPALFMSTFPTSVASNISEQCVAHSRLYASAFFNQSKWALTMYESTGKFPDSYGIHSKIRTHSTGLFDECLTIKADPSGFHGKYCTAIFTVEPIQPEDIENRTVPVDTEVYNNWLAKYQLSQFFNRHQESHKPFMKAPKKRPMIYGANPSLILHFPSIGYCIPSSCSGEDFASAVAQQVGKTAVGNVTVNGELYYTSIVTNTGDPYCFTKEKIDASPDLDGPDIAMIVILSTIGIVVVIATLHESWRLFRNQPIDPKSAGKALLSLHCFSALENVRKLVSTDMPPSDFSCIHGIRFLTSTWIILVHTHTQSVYQPSYNKFMMKEDDIKWNVQAIFHPIPTDTFFTLSSLLVSYSLVRELDRNDGRFNGLLFYVHRYLRLTPMYAIILGFTSTLIVYIGNGPLWQLARSTRESCRDNWWTNMLYISNYKSIWPNPIPCMGQCWFLSVDMQLFCISPLVIYPLWKWRKAGLAWAVFIILASISAIVIIFNGSEIPPRFLGYTRETIPEKVSFYYDYSFQTWPRIPPYVAGIVVGWLLNKTKGTRVELNWWSVATGWSLASAVGLAIIYGLTPYLKEEAVIDSAVSLTYIALHRLAWAVSVGWVIFACVHGYGGFVNRLLSWNAFVPLGRLTYVAYLFHWEYETNFRYYQSRKPYYYTTTEQIVRYISAVSYIFVASFIICLLVEIPLINLERTYIVKSKKQIPTTEREPNVSPDTSNGIEAAMSKL